MANAEGICPVCGYAGLLEPAWSGDSPSYEICPCCGIEFGYDDSSTTQKGRRTRHLELRAAWIAAGYPWWSTEQDPPTGWDPTVQLRRIERMQAT